MNRVRNMRIEDTQQPSAAMQAEDNFSSHLELQVPVIFRFLLASLRDREVAETLTQECFLKAYRNRSSFRGESSPRTWLMRIAINLQKDYWRDRRMQFWRETQANAIDFDLASESLPSGERSPESQMLIREQAAMVWEVVDNLSMRERSVFLLRYMDELQLNEIGRRTGLKVGAVKVYMRRALLKVRKGLEEVDRLRK
jgi:RNA polymerase sigma-70 factor (ECF subfamily)